MKSYLLLAIFLLTIASPGMSNTVEDRIEELEERVARLEYLIVQLNDAIGQLLSLNPETVDDDSGSAVGVYVEAANFTGRGNSTTDAIWLSGPKAKIVARSWDPDRNPRIGFGTIIHLIRPDGSEVFTGSIMLHASATEEEISSESVAMINRPGEYHIQVISGVGWEVTVYDFK